MAIPRGAAARARSRAAPTPAVWARAARTLSRSRSRSVSGSSAERRLGLVENARSVEQGKGKCARCPKRDLFLTLFFWPAPRTRGRDAAATGPRQPEDSQDDEPAVAQLGAR
eukprot:scaffold10102_cov124-Isochrysis_galbana.AAC.3